jgi:hypothetical protein
MYEAMAVPDYLNTKYGLLGIESNSQIARDLGMKLDDAMRIAKVDYLRWQDEALSVAKLARDYLAAFEAKSEFTELLSKNLAAIGDAGVRVPQLWRTVEDLSVAHSLPIAAKYWEEIGESPSFKSAAQSIAEIFSAGSLSGLAASPLSSSLYASIARPMLGSSAEDLFLGSGALASQVQGLLDRTLIALDDPEGEDPFEELKKWVLDQIANHPPSAANYRGFGKILNVVFNIINLLCFLCTYDSWKSGQADSMWIRKHVAGIESTSTSLSREVSALRPKQPVTEYLVLRNARLMSSPRGQGQVIGLLHTGQVVELVKWQRKWIFVKYLSYNSGYEAGGWVLKKYLQRVEGL